MVHQSRRAPERNERTTDAVSVALIWALVLMISANSQVASAQTWADQNSGLRSAAPPPSRPRMSVHELLQGRPVAVSINELMSILEPGHEVVVRDDAGHRTRGRVSSISHDQVVVYQRAGSPLLRLLRPPGERAFPSASVTRIDIVDSTWNGALIGAAVAPLLVYGIHRWEQKSVPDSNNMKGMGTVVFGGASAVLAIAVGRAIDRVINQPIYRKQRGTPRVTIAPALEPSRTGLVMQIRY